MRRAFFLLGLLIGVSLLVSCKRGKEEKFDVVRDDERTYLLDRASGDLYVVNESTIVQLESPLHRADAMQMKTWPDVTLPSGVTVSVRTKYRNGELLYSVTASPFKGQLEKALTGGSSLFVDFYDADRFELGESLTLPLHAATKIVGADGGAVNSLEWLGASPDMPLDAYKIAKYVGVRWTAPGPDVAHADIAAAAADAAGSADPALDAARAAAEAAAAAADAAADEALQGR